MRRRELVIFIILAFILIFGDSFQQKNPQDEFCHTRSSLISTAQAFHVTLENLEILLDEGGEKIAQLYDEEVLSESLEKVNKDAYITDEEGVFHSKFEGSRSTGLATGYIPLNEGMKNFLMATETLDDYYAKCLEEYPFVSQIYYNETRSLSRVFPAFNTKGMVVPGQDLTNYVFYNAAFESGKQSRLISKPYIDPAGQGWVISFVKPVFVDDRLKGVLGVDIKLETLNEMLVISGGMLVVNADGDIITLSEDMYQQIGLRTLKRHIHYQEPGAAIGLPEAYNINRSKIIGFRQMWLQITEEGKLFGEVDFDGKIRKYCAFEIEGFDLYLLHINIL